jgi:hypothetical protein
MPQRTRRDALRWASLAGAGLILRGLGTALQAAMGHLAQDGGRGAVAEGCKYCTCRGFLGDGTYCERRSCGHHYNFHD